MERKLLKFIMQPAMYVAWITGAALAVEGNHLHSTWFHLKVGLVLCLTAAHIYDAVLVRRFASGENRDTDRFYRMLNEVPTVLMIGIVVLVIVKPF
jgi:putative membrane protein